MDPLRRAPIRCLFAAGVVALLAACASTGEDATPTLSRSAQAMGSPGVKTLRYVGTGTGFTFGQAYAPGGVWPKITVNSMTRTIDYDVDAMRDEIVLSRAEPLGGGRYPISGEQRTQVDSVVADPVLGDTRTVTTYSDYRDFGGVKFPMRVRQAMGGHPVLDLAVTAVEVHPAAAYDVPEAARNQAERVVVEPLGAGLWFLAGGSHNSVAIEMADHLVLVEAPLGDARTLAVIEQVGKLAPGKPIRYVVNSHGHFDHSGGVRAAVAEGATIVTGAANVPYFERAFATPNALRPDRMAQAGKVAKFVAVGDKLAMADAMRAIELHAITVSLHGRVVPVADLYAAAGKTPSR